MDHPWVDSSRAPVYVVTFPSSASDETVLAFAAAREAWAERSAFPVAWVVDLSAIREAPASQRKIFAEHLERFERHDIAHNRGSALVVPNTLVRGVVTAVFWVKPPKFPHQLFEKREEALMWATERVRSGLGRRGH